MGKGKVGVPQWDRAGRRSAVIPPELDDRLCRLARYNERTPSAELRIALRRHVEAETDPEADSERETAA
jgi:predicted transcriptional regulator